MVIYFFLDSDLKQVYFIGNKVAMLSKF